MWHNGQADQTTQPRAGGRAPGADEARSNEMRSVPISGNQLPPAGQIYSSGRHKYSPDKDLKRTSAVMADVIQGMGGEVGGDGEVQGDGV